jgi:hypothetical protein
MRKGIVSTRQVFHDDGYRAGDTERRRNSGRNDAFGWHIDLTENDLLILIARNRRYRIDS